MGSPFHFGEHYKHTNSFSGGYYGLTWIKDQVLITGATGVHILSLDRLFS